jgi:hypothetical protein
MSKKLSLTAAILCVIALLAGALSLGHAANVPTPPSKPSAVQNSPAPNVAQQQRETPERFIYRFTFKYLEDAKRRAEEARVKGEDASKLRAFYQKGAALDDAQTSLVEQIATENNAEVARQDKKARQIIDKFRAKYPGGKVPDGEPMPQAPAELAALQAERDAIILKGRDRLRAALGDDAFGRFDAFVHSQIAPKIKVDQLNVPQLNSLRPERQKRQPDLVKSARGVQQ